MLSFSDKGSMLWKEMTARNVNEPIAIVVDNEVYSAPLVRAAIEHGKCQITGDFSTSEVNRLVSIFENGELPLSFNLKE
jgi:SecD/SecF fusion protein